MLLDTGGMIEGRMAPADAGITVAIEAVTGDITLTQFESLQHPTGGLASPDEGCRWRGSAAGGA